MRDGRTISDFIADIDRLCTSIERLEEELDDGYIAIGSTFCTVEPETFNEIRALVKETPKLKSVLSEYETYEIVINGIHFTSTFKCEDGRVNRFTGEREQVR